MLICRCALALLGATATAAENQEQCDALVARSNEATVDAPMDSSDTGIGTAEKDGQRKGEEEREEYTVTFGLGPLEMVLLNTRPITVDSVNSPSHASLHVEVKSQIIKVGDTDIFDGTFQDFRQVLKTLPRPVTLTFLRPSSSSATSSDCILEMDDDEEGEEEEEVGEEEDERKRSGGGGSRGGEKRKKKDDKNGGEENKKPKMH